MSAPRSTPRWRDPLATWGRRAAWLAAAAAFVSALLCAVGMLLRKDVSQAQPPRPAAEVAAITAARNPTLDLARPPRVQVPVDYADATAPWRPRGEAPVLAELVTEGRLPPVAERVGAHPLVLRGHEGIGRYGGTWHRVASANNDVGIVGWRLASITLTRWSPQGYPLVPNLAVGWDVSRDARVYTMHLRRGVRWSDSHPFTSRDIDFWWRHEIRHFGVNPDFMRSHGVLGEVEIVDDFTVRFRFQQPHVLFLEQLASADVALPAHYLSQFHPALGDPARLQSLAQSMKVSTTRAVYSRAKDLFNPDCPRLWPWIYRSYTANPPYTFVRNPYFWAVDEAGNQLPYLDRISFQVRPQNMIGLAATQGAITQQFRHLRLEDYTLLMSERERGGYDVYHWFPATRSVFALFPNTNRRVDPERPATGMKHALLNRREFRQALSLALDRRGIIRAEYNGLGVPAQIDPGPGSPFHHAPLFNAFTAHDPARANALLDQLGLTRRDSEGYRAFSDGTRLTLYVHLTDYTGAGPIQLVIDDWATVGLRAVVKEQTRTLFQSQQLGLEHDISVWTGESEFMPLLSPRSFVPVQVHAFYAPAFGVWYANGGFYGQLEARPGAQPPPPRHPLRSTMELYDDALGQTDPQAQVETFRRILQIAAEELWSINIATPPPQQVVVDRALRNVPPVAIVGTLYRTPANAGTETWWLERFHESPGLRANLKREMVETLPHPSLRPTDDATAKASASQPAPVKRDSAGPVLRGLFLGITAISALLLALRHPFIGRRLVLMVPTLFVISVITFVIIQLPPGDFLSSRIQELEMTGDAAAVQEVRELRTLFHLEESVTMRYLRWVGLPWFLSFDARDAGLLQGNLGRSMETGRLVNEIVGDRIVLTVAISLATILFTWAFALPTGIYSAVRQYSPGDYLLTFVGFIGMCVPNFLLALVLIYLARELFGIQVTGLFSEQYALQPEWTSGKFIDLLQHIWIPVVVLGVGGTAGMIRVMRGNLLDELRKPYVTTARAIGMRPLALLLKYPVRLALNPFISGIGGIFPHLVSGGAIVSMVLALPTVGPLMLTALLSQDMYLAGSMLMVLSALGVFGTLVSDLLLLWLDPRIRLEGGAR